MKPFKDESLFRPHSALPTTSPKTLPDFVYAQGNELRNGLRIYARKNLVYFSSGEWLDEYETGNVSQEIQVTVLGENQDPLRYTAYNDQDERKSPVQVLSDGEIVVSDTIDYDNLTAKDGRITIFSIRSRALVSREEYPYDMRGFKVTDSTIDGLSTGINYSPFNDYSGYDLGLNKMGYYGIPDQVTETFIDHTIINSLGFEIDYGDYDTETIMGNCGTPLYSAVFGTDSIAYAGLLR